MRAVGGMVGFFALWGGIFRWLSPGCDAVVTRVFFSPGFPGLFGGDEDACAVIDNFRAWCRMGCDDQKNCVMKEIDLCPEEVNARMALG